MSRFERYLPWSVVAVAVLYLAACAMPPHHSYDGFELDDFATLPVVFNGRVQPLDSVARNALMVVSGKQTFVDEDDQTQPAIRWLLEVVVGALKQGKGLAPFEEYKVFRIENQQVLDIVGLKERPGLRYSFAEIAPKLPLLNACYKEAQRKNEEKIADLFDAKILELSEHVGLFDKIMAQRIVFTMPFLLQGDSKPEWLALAQLRDVFHSGDKHRIDMVESLPSVYHFRQMLKAYHDKDVHEAQLDPGQLIAVRREQLKQSSAEFNKALADYRDWLKKNLPSEYRVAQFETGFNRMAPFYQAAVLNVFVFLLACMSWTVWPKTLERSALALGIVALLVQTGALFSRMYIMDRPLVLVTNLYSSAVFIGWGCSALGLLLEFVFRNGVGCVVGSVAGGLSLIIAHYLSLDGDTMNMLVAVLDTNFWLATHVTCVTMGYTATLIAGFIGIYYVLINLFDNNVKPQANQDTARMLYGILCFATMLSFVGTVLGGIWADQSWGRFWGWDPKENGALLIVLMNALILHARWAGMVKARGMAVLAILGNIVVSWSWFGVNMLSIGLHNYGFMAGVVVWLIIADVTFLLLAVLGMFDPKHVRAFLAWMAEALGISAVAPVNEKVEV